MLNRIFLGIISALFLLFIFLRPAAAQTQQVPKQTEVKGSIISVKTKDFDENGKLQKISYHVKLDNGATIVADYQPSDTNKLTLNEGDQIVMERSPGLEAVTYQIVDMYRIPTLLWFLVGFAVIATLLVGRKGVGSLLGLLVSLGVILFGIVPLILKGFDPLIVTIAGSIFIILITTYLS